MFKFCFYVPIAAAEKVKEAVFAVGAGRIGQYDCCCWQVEGEGQFRPLENSAPALGEKNEINIVKEMKIEMVCEENKIHAAVTAMLEAHPYEEPAYQVWRVLTLNNLSDLSE